VTTEPSSSPLAFLATEVKRLREQAGMKQDELADHTGYSPATVAAIETCRVIPSAAFTDAADKVFGTDGILGRLREMVEETSARPWFRDLLNVERKAKEIRRYVTYVIPGLLQTEAYARCCVSPTRPALTADEIDRAIALRMTRQGILERDDPPMLWAIIDESALRRANGGADVMAGQLAHLLKMSERPNIVIQVIPDSEGSTVAGGREFTIMTFPSDPPVIYLEDLGSARYIRNRKTDEVSRYMLAFDHLRSTALRDDRSTEFIMALMRGHQK
jgi:transcriptional regulator with XRE-family HTH domain